MQEEEEGWSSLLSLVRVCCEAVVYFQSNIIVERMNSYNCCTGVMRIVWIKSGFWKPVSNAQGSDAIERLHDALTRSLALLTRSTNSVSSALPWWLISLFTIGNIYLFSSYRYRSENCDQSLVLL